MKFIRNKLSTISIVMLVFGLSSVLTVNYAFAATGRIYLTPSASSIKKDETVTVSVRITPGTTVDSVQGTLTYDTSRLQFVSVNTAGSAFSAELTNTQSSGSVNFARGDFGSGVSSDALVETITFKGLATVGTANIGLSGANAASGGTFTNPASSGTSVTIYTPVATPTPSPQPSTPTPSPTTPSPSKSTPGTSSTPKSGSSSTTPKSGSSSTPQSGASSSTPTSVTPSIPKSDSTTTILGKNISYNQATIQFSTTVPTTTYILYGVGDDLSLQTATSSLSTDHTISLDPALLIPGEKYSYMIVSTTQDGVQTSTEKRTLQVKGLTVAVRVFDDAKKPLRKQKVTIHSEPQTVTTDDNGTATFTNVVPGKHRVVYTNGKEYAQSIQVSNNVKTVNGVATADVQNFAVIYDVSNHDTLYRIVIILILCLVIAGAGLALFLTRQKIIALPLISQFFTKRNQPSATDTASSEADAVEQIQPAALYGVEPISSDSSEQPQPPAPTPTPTSPPALNPPSSEPTPQLPEETKK
jgi:hypothetical protein